MPESPIRHSGCPERIHPHPARVDGGRVDVRVRVEIEVGQPLVTGKAGCPDPADGAAPGPVVTFREQQLGEEPLVGELFLLRDGDHVGDQVADGRQAQLPAGGVDRRCGGLLGQASAAADRLGHDTFPFETSGTGGVGRRMSSSS